MANRAQIPTSNSALIAMIADEVRILWEHYISSSLIYRMVMTIQKVYITYIAWALL